jgi:uncharacterized protein (DUF2147 family)|tara:strand:+ start:256 stop:708 length:453 start_codon:yes stop_codon:yes gene_type:complete
MKRILLLATMALFTFQSQAQSADDITGTWWTYHDDKKSGQVEVYKYKDSYRGRIVHVVDNKNPDGTSPKLDNFNPDESKRSRVIQGMRVMIDMRWDADDKEWSGGQIYDTKSGNTYDCYAYLQEDGSLYFKGYLLGIRLIGRSTSWTRVE